MTGKMHMAVNGAISAAIFMDPAISGLAMISAKLPDQAEKFFPGMKHRTHTHYLLFWLLAAGAAWGAGWFGLGSPWTVPVVFGILLGGALHIFMDMFSRSGIPVYPGQVWRGRLYRTGGVSEYVFGSVILLLCGFIFVVRMQA